MNPDKVKALERLLAKKQKSSSILNTTLYCLYTGTEWEDALEEPASKTNNFLLAVEHEKLTMALLLMNVMAASNSKKGYESMQRSLKKRIKEIESSL